jgi:hypothetical protein
MDETPRLLFSSNSTLRLLKAFTKILSCGGGCKRLNIEKPKKGFATNNSIEILRNIFAEFTFNMEACCLYDNKHYKVLKNLFIIGLVTLMLQRRVFSSKTWFIMLIGRI